MYYLLQPLRVIWKVWFFLFFLAWLIVLYPIFWVLFMRRAWFKHAFNLMRALGMLLQIGSGIVLLKKYKAPLPKSPYVIVANHSSYLDIVLMYNVFQEYFVFMGKAEIKDWPLFNIFFTKNMNILVNRGSIMEAHKAYKRATEEIDKGSSIAIFPEGTIPSDAPNLKRFKSGAFKLAIEKQVPIVVVTFLNNWERLQTGAVLRVKGGPGLTRVIIHEPISTVGLTDKDEKALMESVYAMMNGPLVEWKNHRSW